MVQTTTVVAATVGTLATGFLAYAVYFDHRRRTDPGFRKQLKKESRRQARAAKEAEAAQGLEKKKEIRAKVAEAQRDGFPQDVEEKEAYFMQEVQRGETMSQSGPEDHIEAALSFYKALKVYPQPMDLMSIYDKTVAKEVVDILAEMIAADDDLRVPTGGSEDGMPAVPGLD